MLASGVGVITLRLLTEALNPNELGALTGITLILALVTGATTLPILQFALRHALGRPRASRGLVLRGVYAKLELRFTLFIVVLVAVVALAAYATRRDPTTILLFLAGFVGMREWSIAKTELNGLQRDTTYQILATVPIALPAIVAALAGHVLHLPLDRILLAYFATLLVSGVIARRFCQAPRRQRMEGAAAPAPEGDSAALVGEALLYAPTGVAAWLVSSLPRWYVVGSGGLASLALFSAVWSPINQAFLTLGTATLLLERPRLYLQPRTLVALLPEVRSYVRALLLFGFALAGLIIGTAGIWQSIALAQIYRTSTVAVLLICVANLIIVLGQPLEQLLFLVGRQWMVWLPGVLLAPLLFVIARRSFPDGGLLTGASLAVVLASVDLVARAALILWTARSERRHGERPI